VEGGRQSWEAAVIVEMRRVKRQYSRPQFPVVLMPGQTHRLHFLEIFLFSSQSVSGPEGLRFSFKGHPCQA
jgi:hypothetical protein